MAFTLDNFVRSILAVDATATDTSLVVALAAPPQRDPPDASAGAPGILILQDSASAPTKIEIVTYTGKSVDGTRVTLSGVTRGLEGTTAQAWTAGATTFSGSTAAVLAGFATSAALSAVQASLASVSATASSALQPGEGLSSLDSAAATKLAGIAAGAEVNVQPDWTASSGDGQILHKPTLGTAAAQDTTAFATAAQGDKADSALQDASAFATAADGELAQSAVQPGTSPTFVSPVCSAVEIVGGALGGPNWRATVSPTDGALGRGAGILFSATFTSGWGGADYSTHASGGIAYIPGTVSTAARAHYVALYGNTPTADDPVVLAMFGQEGWYVRTNDQSGSVVKQPRIFVQSSDPGLFASDGDLWLW